MRVLRQPDGAKGSRKEIGRNRLGNSLFLFLSKWMGGRMESVWSVGCDGCLVAKHSNIGSTFRAKIPV